MSLKIPKHHRLKYNRYFIHGKYNLSLEKGIFFCTTFSKLTKASPETSRGKFSGKISGKFKGVINQNGQ